MHELDSTVDSCIIFDEMLDSVSLNAVGATNGFDYCGQRDYYHYPDLDLSSYDFSSPNLNLADLQIPSDA